jgi:hypothetical protein
MLEALTYRGVIAWGPRGLVGGHYLEIRTYNSHGNCFYMLLMSVSCLLYMDFSNSDHIDLQTDIREKLVTYAIFWVFGSLQTLHMP